MDKKFINAVEFFLEQNSYSSKKQDYDAVLETSLTTLLLVRSLRDVDGTKEVQKAILPSIYFAISKILPELVTCSELESLGSTAETKPTCSFCGRIPPEVRLGAGPNAFICNECVDTFHEIFYAAQSSV